jgi:hypothetical protein
VVDAHPDSSAGHGSSTSFPAALYSGSPDIRARGTPPRAIQRRGWNGLNMRQFVRRLRLGTEQR